MDNSHERDVKAVLRETLARWLRRAGSFTLPIVLVLVAAPRFVSGLATEAAFPIPIYLSMNVRVPTESYRIARDRLMRADPSDGDAKIAQAEAGIYSGANPISTVQILEEGLSLAPASARGWMLLAEQSAHSDTKRAALALTVSLELDEFDYWLVDRRIRDAALLWHVMPVAGKGYTFRQIRLIWQTPILRARIEPLLAEQGVAAIFSRAFAGDRETLRAINRWRAASHRSRNF